MEQIKKIFDEIVLFFSNIQAFFATINSAFDFSNWVGWIEFVATIILIAVLIAVVCLAVVKLAKWLISPASRKSGK